MKLAEFNWPDLEQVSRDVVVVFPIASLESTAPISSVRHFVARVVGATPGTWRRQ